MGIPTQRCIRFSTLRQLDMILQWIVYPLEEYNNEKYNIVFVKLFSEFDDWIPTYLFLVWNALNAIYMALDFY